MYKYIQGTNTGTCKFNWPRSYYWWRFKCGEDFGVWYLVPGKFPFRTAKMLSINKSKLVGTAYILVDTGNVLKLSIETRHNPMLLYFKTNQKV